MNRNLKKVLAVVLTLVMLMSSFVVCFAAVEVNTEAAAKHYGQYTKYLLLGDSAASGYRDEITEDDFAAELPDIVAGFKQGRTNPTERLMCELVGMGSPDLCVATLAYNRVMEANEDLTYVDMMGE